jgi:Spy/CpxP family protein refolding chaperone
MPHVDEKTMRRPLLALILTTLFGACAMAPAFAQDAPPPRSQDSATSRPWRSLDADQRDVLAPLQKDWDTFSPRRQQRMLDKASRWVTLPEPRREEIRQRIDRWQKMTPAERDEARRNMQRFHDLTPEQRDELHAAFDRYRQLPADQRDALIRKWQQLSPAERERSLKQLGPDSVLPPNPPRPRSGD